MDELEELYEKRRKLLDRIDNYFGDEEKHTG